uniref:Uncharacterized protein n=1 Tax=Trichuris muris TaxID=70415 RepID=A0A5S6QGB4_TRIMR
MKTFAVLYLVYLACIFAAKTEEEQQLMITRILKPTDGDEEMRNELFERINAAERVCKEGKCKVLRDQLVAGAEISVFAKVTKEYDTCMDDCRVKEQRSFDLLKELERKADYWKNFQEVKSLSLKDALVYWAEIKGEFKLLEEEENKYEAAMEKLRLTKEEAQLKEKLDAEIREQDQKCKTTTCASLREALLTAKIPEDQIAAADKFFDCMKKCKEPMNAQVEQLDKLQEREDYLANMEELRTEMSVLDALQYFDEIESSSTSLT